MAITQSRMIELIRIADALTTTILFHKEQIYSIITALPQDLPRDDLISAVRSIQTLTHSLSISPSHLNTLAAERAHFKLNARRNDRIAKKARQRRGVALDAISATAPQSLTSKPTPQPDLPAIVHSLSSRKIEINKIHKKFNMPEPYSNPHNDTEPLLPEHNEMA
jgi:hypothetical protein